MPVPLLDGQWTGPQHSHPWTKIHSELDGSAKNSGLNSRQIIILKPPQSLTVCGG